MSAALADYLAALEARDVREKAHEQYIHAYTKLADRTASLRASAPTETEETSSSTKTIKPTATKGKGSPAPAGTASPTALSQIRSELASTQRMRGELETKVATLTTELSTLQATDTQQKKHIKHLEKIRASLERRGKDRTEELVGKGRFVEEVQDEMIALTLQLNMAEQEKEKLKKENEELTRRWVKKMEEEARRMNDESGWEEHAARRK